MTREEAIEVLNMVEAHGSLVVEAKDMAIKALEQEEYYKDLAQSYERTITKLTEAIAEQQPSEDCVSRTQAIEFVNEVIGGKNDFADAIRDGVVAVLSALPPVTPTRKKGKWIDGCTEKGALGIRYTEKICSKCGWSHSLIIPKKYCPNCGAEMESEE